MYAYVSLLICVMGLLYAGMGAALLPSFIALCLVIYSTLSGRFGTLVLMLNQPIRHSLKDWIKVNAFVSIVAYGLTFMASAVLLGRPEVFSQIIKQNPEILKQNGVTVTTAQFMAVFKLILVISLMILVHCIWTLRLVRRFRDFFQ
jgi:hypothetical protein